MKEKSTLLLERLHKIIQSCKEGDNIDEVTKLAMQIVRSEIGEDRMLTIAQLKNTPNTYDVIVFDIEADEVLVTPPKFDEQGRVYIEV